MLFINVSVKGSQYEVDVVGQPAEGKGQDHDNHHLHHLSGITERIIANTYIKPIMPYFKFTLI